MTPQLKNQFKLWSRILHANVGIVAAFTLGLIALSCPFIAHRSEGPLGESLKAIHYGEFLPTAWRWVWIDVQGAMLLFLVVSGWLVHSKTVRKAAAQAADDPRVPGSSVTLVWTTGSDRARTMAHEYAQRLEAAGLRSFCVESAKYAFDRLNLERYLVCFEEPGHRIGVPAINTPCHRLEFAVVEAVADTSQGSATSPAAEALRAAGARPLPLGDATHRWADTILERLSGRPLAERPYPTAVANVIP